MCKRVAPKLIKQHGRGFEISSTEDREHVSVRLNLDVLLFEKGAQVRDALLMQCGLSESGAVQVPLLNVSEVVYLVHQVGN